MCDDESTVDRLGKLSLEAAALGAIDDGRIECFLARDEPALRPIAGASHQCLHSGRSRPEKHMRTSKGALDRKHEDAIDVTRPENTRRVVLPIHTKFAQP